MCVGCFVLIFSTREYARTPTQDKRSSCRPSRANPKHSYQHTPAFVSGGGASHSDHHFLSSLWNQLKYFLSPSAASSGLADKCTENGGVSLLVPSGALCYPALTSPWRKLRPRELGSCPRLPLLGATESGLEPEVLGSGCGSSSSALCWRGLPWPDWLRVCSLPFPGAALLHARHRPPACGCSGPGKCSSSSLTSLFSWELLRAITKF